MRLSKINNQASRTPQSRLYVYVGQISLIQICFRHITFCEWMTINMTGKFQTEFKTPWAVMKASQELIPKIFNSKGPLEPLASRDSITYFNNNKEKWRLRQGHRIRTGYDRMHDATPFNPKQQRCDRTEPGIIWAGIHEENKQHKVAINTSHWHGRPNRVQLDFPESKFYRSNKIQDQFHRRSNINIDYDLDRPCHTY